MLSDYYSAIPIRFDFIDQVYSELSQAQFYVSKTRQTRSDVSPELKQKFRDVLPFNIYCCGFFKNPPGWFYPMHKDVERLCALNVLLCDESQNFETFCYDDGRKQIAQVDYRRDVPILLNTKKFHSVRNNDTATRYLLSIGCIDEDYESVKRKLHDHFNAS